MKSSTSGLCPECAHIHPRQEPGWPASWVAEAAALSCRQDFRPLHQLGPENKLLPHFPAPTQPRSPRGEPEAHTPAAAYTKPLITTKGLSRNPWRLRLRCLQKGLCWLRAIHVGRVHNDQWLSGQAGNPRSQFWVSLALRLLRMGTASQALHPWMRVQLMQQSTVHTVKREYSLSHRLGHFMQLSKCWGLVPGLDKRTRVQDNGFEAGLSYILPAWPWTKSL